ncbi:MAG TPA: LytTR family DNA-binding domain-containing protein [Thermoanaerobaculia bacterium]|nr:LytTR family DNA-binding domain-containing protein [Thermoanaerobaculia bacterium]
MSRLRALVVDDEPLARQHITRMLEGSAGFVVCGESENGREAIEAILELRPDLVLLDIQMPEVDGFDVVRALDPAETPAIIFTTAWDQYALRAFDVHAIDYLLKPIEPEQFHAALARAASLIEKGERATPVDYVALAGLISDRTSELHRLVVRSGSRILFLRAEEIDWIEAAGNYVRIRRGNESFLYRDTMISIERKLSPSRFVRIQRSVIVNVDRIRELRHEGKGDYTVILGGTTTFSLSPLYRERLERIVGRF